MRPSIGRIVHVGLGDQEAQLIGGNARSGDLAPAIVTEVFSDTKINVRIFGDGGGPVLWATSLEEGVGPGTWCWPARVE